MTSWKKTCSGIVTDVRGKGLLLIVEFCDEKTTARIMEACLSQRLFVCQTQGNGIRVFPALNIDRSQLEDGLAILGRAIDRAVQEKD